MTKLIYEEVQAAISKTNGDLIAACVILNAKYPTVYAFIKRHNIPFSSKKHLTCTKEQIEEAYSRLGSLSLVAKELGGTKEGIRLAMRRCGLKINPQVLHTCNENFFSDDSEQSFYWAGFIAADGCVKIRKNTQELTIALAKKDSEHLDKFRTSINTTAPIHDYLVKNSERSSEWNDTWKSELLITSKMIYSDLQKFNIVPRKSLIYSFPEWLIDHPMVNHFMRGYFDGDGSFYISKLKEGRTVEQVYFSLRGTTEFLTVYRDILERECNLDVREKPIRVNNGIGILEYGGNGIVKKIADFLYRDATVYLNRKYDILGLR